MQATTRKAARKVALASQLSAAMQRKLKNATMAAARECGVVVERDVTDEGYARWTVYHPVVSARLGLDDGLGEVGHFFDDWRDVAEAVVTVGKAWQAFEQKLMNAELVVWDGASWILVKFGVSGFWHTRSDLPDTLPGDVTDAAIFGSMFGWHLPGAVAAVIYMARARGLIGN